jgi:hypothetical protein
MLRFGFQKPAVDARSLLDTPHPISGRQTAVISKPIVALRKNRRRGPVRVMSHDQFILV